MFFVPFPASYRCFMISFNHNLTNFFCTILMGLNCKLIQQFRLVATLTPHHMPLALVQPYGFPQDRTISHSVDLQQNLSISMCHKLTHLLYSVLTTNRVVVNLSIVSEVS